MGLRIRVALLMCAVAAAVYSGAEAWRSLQPAGGSIIPEELSVRYAAAAETAQYYLRDNGGHVAVYQKKRGAEPLAVTDIELDCLRSVDRALVEQGLPVADRWELLQLLEDLGS